MVYAELPPGSPPLQMTVSETSNGINSPQVNSVDLTGCSGTVHQCSHLVLGWFQLTAGPSMTQYGNLLTASYPGATSYQWFLNGILIPGAVADTISITQSGHYAVTATSTGGCTTGSDLQFFHFTSGEVGVGSLQPGSLTVSPNPSNGTLNLQAQVGSPDEVRITVLDAAGHCAWQATRYTTNGKLEEELSLDQLPAGLYLLRLDAQGGQATRRIAILGH